MADFEDKTAVLDTVAAGVASAAPNERSACFVVLAGGQAGKMYKLETDELMIGRGTEALVRVTDDGVSRRHAKILRNEDGSLAVVDLGSTNGTFVNGERISHRVLRDGDKLQIGTTTILKFSYQDSVEEDFQRRQYESATRDTLTQVFNRKYFLEHMPMEFAFSRRHKKALTLAMCDIDHFKAINDTFGHPAGDYVLKNVSRLMQNTIRGEDTLARVGGEEFVVSMRDTKADAAFIAAERIRRTIEASDFFFDKRPIRVTISIGLATLTDQGPDSAEGLIKLADQYLYKAKRNGRNRTESPMMP